MEGRLKQTFLQRIHASDQQTHEKISTSPIKEMQVRATMRYHLTLVRMAICRFKNLQIINVERMWRKGNPLALLVGL